MADDAEARREARRRRILENAQSRLEKITGRKEEPAHENNGANDILHYTSMPEMNGAVPSLSIDDFASVIRGRASYKQNQSSSSSSAAQLLDGIPNSHLNTLLEENPEPEEISRSQPLLTSYLTICLLAILVRLLYTFQMSHVYGDMIFLPLICLETFNLTLYQPEKESLGMLGATLLLCGFTPTVTNSVARYLSIVKRLTFDFSLYFFTFVLSHVIFSNLETNLPV